MSKEINVTRIINRCLMSRKIPTQCKITAILRAIFQICWLILFIRMIRDVTPYWCTCDYFSNMSFAQSHAVHHAGVKGRRESENVPDSTAAWPAGREQEGRSKVRDRHGRKLVSFVKFFERKVPRSPFVIFLARACPRRSDRNLSRSDGSGVYNEDITCAHLTLDAYSPID